MSGHRHQAFQNAGKRTLTRNSPCPVHGTHNIKYCPIVKDAARLQIVAAEQTSAEKAAATSESGGSANSTGTQ